MLEKEKSYRKNFLERGYIQDRIIILVMLVLTFFAFFKWSEQAKEAQLLSQRINELNQKAKEQNQLLDKINIAYDELLADENELRQIVNKEPWLKLEWELKNDPDQVRGVDGKLPKERR